MNWNSMQRDFDSSDSEDSPDDLGDPKRHWLQRKPVDFTYRAASTGRAIATRGDLTVAYDKLTLHFCFFIDGKLQFFKRQSSISSMDDGLLCVPCETVELNTQNPSREKCLREEQDMPLQELVQSMLQDEIRSGVLRSVQFMDYAYDDYIVLNKTQSGRVKDGYEYYELDIAVMLSLDAGTTVATNRTLTFPRLARSPIYYDPEAAPSTEARAKIDQSHGKMTDPFSRSVLEQLFERERKFLSDEDLARHHKWDKQPWQEKYCERRITSAVSTWKTLNSHGRNQTIYGFVTHRDDHDGIHVFLMDKHNYRNNRTKTHIKWNFDDGKGGQGFRVVGRLAVKDLNQRNSTKFLQWDGRLYGKMIGEEARLKVSVVDLWHV